MNPQVTVLSAVQLSGKQSVRGRNTIGESMSEISFEYRSLVSSIRRRWVVLEIADKESAMGPR